MGVESPDYEGDVMLLARAERANHQRMLAILLLCIGHEIPWSD
jgi:hypothetical protein